MYNITKLSQASQIFLKTVSGNTVTDLAVGKAIAAKLPLPSFEVASYKEHFQSVVEAMARELVSQLNEIIMIDARAVLAHVEMFWKVRYVTVFPQTNAVHGAGNFLGTFMGYGNLIPLNVYEQIQDNLTQLTRNVRGFNQIVQELQETVVTEEPNDDDRLVNIETVSAETYRGTRNRHILAGA